MMNSNEIFQSLTAQTITTTDLPDLDERFFDVGYCAKCDTHFPQIQYHYCGGDQMRRWDARPGSTPLSWGPPDPKDEYLKIMADRLNYLEGDNERLRRQNEKPFIIFDEAKKDYAEPVPYDPNKSSARLDVLLFTILGLIIVASALITWRLIPEVL